jgi:hypothetical protein
MVMPATPGRLSMTNDCPSRSDSHWPSKRSLMSADCDNTHQPRRIGLRAMRDTGRQRGGARCQTKIWSSLLKLFGFSPQPRRYPRPGHSGAR